MSKQKKNKVVKKTNASNTNKVRAIVGITLGSILLLLIALLVINKVQDMPESSKTSEPTVEATRESDLSGATRASLLEASETFLNKFLQSDQSVDERLNALLLGDFSVVDPSVEDMILFPENYTSEDKAYIYQALITITDLADQDGDKRVERNEEYANQIVFYENLGIGYVPFSYYASQNTVYSFEFVYTDDGWKLVPVSLYNSIKYLVINQYEQEQGQN